MALLMVTTKSVAMGFSRDAVIIGHNDQERVDVAILILSTSQRAHH